MKKFLAIMLTVTMTLVSACATEAVPAQSEEASRETKAVQAKTEAATTRPTTTTTTTSTVTTTTATTQSKVRDMEPKEYAKKAKDLSYELLAVGVSAEGTSDLIIRIWRNTIYKDKEDDTDPYTLKSDGSFNDSFNDSLANYFSTDEYKATVAVLEPAQPKLTRSVKEMRDCPEDCIYIYEALAEYHEAIDGIVELAINPSGSYSSYSGRYSELQDKFVEANKTLKSEIDLILNP